MEKSTFCCVSVPRGNCIDTAICNLLSSPYSPRRRPRASPTLTRSYQEDSTLSQRNVGMPEFNDLMDMARLLVNLWEAAQRLPDGSERRNAFRQISGFQSRVAVLVTRAL